jgi:Family of unknown function (DUF5754)
MMKVYVLEQSSNPKKKFTAIRILPSLKRIPFGAKGYDDFTTHKDNERKNSYIRRHSSSENWNDSDTAGFWSRWILWNKKTLDQSINDTEKRFDIRIIKAF